MAVDPVQLRDLVEYLRDLGIYDFYRQPDVQPTVLAAAQAGLAAAESSSGASLPQVPRTVLPAASQPPVATPRPVSPDLRAVPPAVAASANTGPEMDVRKPVAFDQLAPLPEVRVRPADRAAALAQVREQIGDCTRCPLAYAGRHTIVFGEGDPAAQLMFVGEAPAEDEDVAGQPFLGKAGQLLNNMIQAMGLRREQVYLANVVKCRPPQNRMPEPVEVNTCSQFLLQQIDIVQPRVIVALGETAAMYLLGVEQPLGSLRGGWQSCRGAKVAVTFHPASLLREPRQKAEAWKDLQRVMLELELKAPARG